MKRIDKIAWLLFTVGFFVTSVTKGEIVYERSSLTNHCIREQSKSLNFVDKSNTVHLDSKKEIISDTVFNGLISKSSESNKDIKSYEVVDSLCVKIVANFEEGIDYPFDINKGNFAPHYWAWESPQYSYTYVDGQNLNTKIGTTTDQPDNSNFWNVYAKDQDPAGVWTEYCDIDYSLILTKEQTYFPTTYDSKFITNYQNWSGYKSMIINRSLTHSETGKLTNLQIFFYSPINGWNDLGTFIYPNDVTDTISIPLTKFPSDVLSKVGTIKFRVFNIFLTPGSTTSFQRTEIKSIKLTRDPVSKTRTLDNLTCNTNFIGSVSHKRYGSYSATGFFDTESKTYKIWFGGGAPERNSMDNVYYYESPSNSMAPGTDFTNAIRCTLDDGGVLARTNNVIFSWGDPSVIKVDGIYYIYFSAQTNMTTNVNHIFRATSVDGKDFVMDPKTPVVSGGEGGASGYGSGSPSIVYKDGVYYLYYFSTNEQSPSNACFLRTSSDGIAWGDATIVAMNQPAMDIKYIDSIGKWIGITEDGSDQMKLKTAISSDGINWIFTANNTVASDPAMNSCHNSGFIGDPFGHGFMSMYYTFGASEQSISPSEYLTRQLEYGSYSLLNDNSVFTHVGSVSVTPKTILLNLGEKTTLIANMLPENATNKTISWHSDDTKVVTVSAAGVVTARGNGIAKVIINSMDGNLKDSCMVTVGDQTGIIIKNMGKVKIFPNPASSYVIIDINTEVKAENTFKIINSLGMTIFQKTTDEQQVKIESNRLNGKGIYFVQIYDSSGKIITTRKLIMQ